MTGRGITEVKLNFKVRGQKLELLSHPGTIVGGSINYLDAAFDFSSEWNGLDKAAFFRCGDKTFYALLKNDRIEQGIDLGAGVWEVHVIGSRMDGADLIKRIPTDVISFAVKEGGGDEGEPFPVEPPSLGEQILGIAEAALRAASEVKQAAESGEFDGDDYVITEADYDAIAEKAAEKVEISGGGITKETDPTVPAWAKQPNKPAYTADEVGALSQDRLQDGVNLALAQAKKSGEFDGDDYVLTDADKTEIAEMAAELVDVPEGGGADISLGVSGATVGQTVRITAVDENGVPTAWEAANMASGGEWVTLVDDTLTEAVTYYRRNITEEEALLIDKAKNIIMRFDTNTKPAERRDGVYFVIYQNYGFPLSVVSNVSLGPGNGQHFGYGAFADLQGGYMQSNVYAGCEGVSAIANSTNVQWRRNIAVYNGDGKYLGAELRLITSTETGFPAGTTIKIEVLI